MKKILFATAVVASSFGMLNAQNAKTTQTAATEAKAEKLPEARAKELVSKINTTCQLNGDQWTKVNNLCVDFFKQHDALKAQKATMDAKTFETKMNELKATRDKGLAAALTPEQNRKLEVAKTAEKKN